MEDIDISLFPHNEEAYEALCASLENYPLAFIEHATGTGKSFILLKYLYTKMRKKRVLFISMHDEMFGQLFDEQMPSLGMKRSDFNVFDTMIYHNILKYDMQSIIRNYDCIIFDEAHHCGAEKWSEKVRELKELVLTTPGKVMIGATATGIRYLDDYLDVSEEYFDGKTVSRLPISKAILGNLLPAPLYINSLTACASSVERISHKLSKLPRTEELSKFAKRVSEIEEQVTEESEIGTVLKQYDVKPGEKYIVFCRNIEDLKQKRAEAEKWFKNIGPIRTFAAHSDQKKEQNMSEIKAFGEKREEISLMFAVDIFNEGFHISGVDGVLMFRKTKSPIVYLQQLGRALSFSVRKKQIKIFDFVDNISDNDVIYELYKEIIEEAKKLTREHPENKELYESILRRFQIIDKTTSILEELRDIERIINENYIFKGLLNNAIIKLQEYRSFYPKTNFAEELNNRRLSFDYTRAYEYICKNIEHLTSDQIELLQKLNIEFGPFTSLNKNERDKVLQGFKTLSELNEEVYKNFIQEYIAFYNKYNRRPLPSNDEYEYNLYRQHRSYLEELTASKINKMVLNFPFKSTVEEIVLTGNYPDKHEIEEYIHYIKDKLLSNEPLDIVEVRVTKKLRNTISLKDAKLINMLNNIDDIAYRIEESIEIIRFYKENVDPNERFVNYIAFYYNKELYKAIKTIHKHAKRITTPQFIKLLELDIELPKVIDMTLEERTTALGIYNSFYEKEKNDTIGILNDFIIFIVQNSRRPDLNIEEERELAENYETHIRNSSTVKIREISELLKANRIPLTFYEKVIIGDFIDQETLDSYIDEVYHSLLRNENISDEDLKLLRAIERHAYSISMLHLNYFIKMIINTRNLIEDITKLEESMKKYPNIDYKDLPITVKTAIRRISNNQKYLTKSLIERLEKVGIPVSTKIKEEVLNLQDSISVGHKEIVNNDIFAKEFFEYISTHNSIPSQDSTLYIKYRSYLANMAPSRVTAFLKKCISLGVKLGLEERILLEEFEPYSKEVQEYITLKKSQPELDELEKKVLSAIAKKLSISEDRALRKVLRDTSRIPTNDRTEDRIVSNLIACIYSNPEQELNFNSTIHGLSFANQKKLENLRTRLLAKKYFDVVIKLLKQNKKPLRLVLDESDQIKLQSLLKLEFIDKECVDLIQEIKNLDSEYELIEQGIQKKKFLEKYIAFIKANNGNKPNLLSSNPEEKALAEEYEIISKTLSIHELRVIDKAIKEATTTVIEATFYDRFHLFVITHGRFPCGNSDDPEEVKLNNLYVTMSDILTKEQIKELSRLKKLYSKATLQANMAFAKKRK